MRNFDDRVENLGATAAGRLSAAEDNVRFKEMENFVSSSGISLDPQNGPDSDLNMQAQAAARYASGGIFGSCTGAANTYVVAATGSFIVPKALFDGMRVITKPSATNTNTSTANVFGLGSKAIRTWDDQALSGGELVTDRPTLWEYDSTANSSAGAWLILPWASAAAAPGNGQPLHPDTGRWSGMELGYVSTTSVKVLTGETWADDLLDIIVASSDLTLDLTTTGALGLDAGTLANNTWYDVYLIKNRTTSAVSAIASTAATPTIPSGYDAKRYIGSFKTNGSSQVEPFDQVQALVKFRTAQYDKYFQSAVAGTPIAPGGNGGVSNTTAILSVPRRRRVKANCWLAVRVGDANSSQGTALLHPTDTNNPWTNTTWQQEPAVNDLKGASWWSAPNVVNYPGHPYHILTNVDGEVGVGTHVAAGNNPYISVQTYGWEYL